MRCGDATKRSRSNAAISEALQFPCGASRIAARPGAGPVAAADGPAPPTPARQSGAARRWARKPATAAQYAGGTPSVLWSVPATTCQAFGPPQAS